MHVGILTYQRGHLKTFQVVKKLLTKPCDITLFAFPFISRTQKKVVFADKPDQLIDFDIKGFCARHKIGYVEVEGWKDKYAFKLGNTGSGRSPEVYLTCIGKIIPESFLKGRMILNVHPGLLPENRGLDAFKWSVVNGWPIGISLHVIDRDIDKGILLHRVKVPVLPQDTLSDVAARSYEMGCSLLSNFDYYLPRLKYEKVISDKYPLSKQLISPDTDRKLEEIFLKQREKLIMLSNEADNYDFSISATL